MWQPASCRTNPNQDNCELVPVSECDNYNRVRFAPIDRFFVRAHAVSISDAARGGLAFDIYDAYTNPVWVNLDDHTFWPGGVSLAALLAAIL